MNGAAVQCDATRAASADLATAGRELVRHLVTLIRTGRLHDPANRALREPVHRLQDAVGRAIGLAGRVDLETFGADVFLNGARLRIELRDRAVHGHLMSHLEELGIGGLRFDVVPDGSAVRALLRVLLAAPGCEGDGVSDINRRLAENGVGGVLALPVRSGPVGRSGGAARRPRDVYDEALELIRGVITARDGSVQLQAAICRAGHLVHELVDLTEGDGGSFELLGLAAIRSHDEYTFNHMVNVCVLAIAFGRRLGMSRRDVARLGLCGLFHDVGKLDVPIEILAKHGLLEEDEWAVMGNHPVFGARRLFALAATDNDATLRAVVALGHHRGHDGGGYPAPRPGCRPHLFARIVAIVDAFDAMTTQRVYQRRMLPDEAVEKLMRAAGGRLDPVLVKAFIGCIGVYPVGSTVLLSSGDLAEVCAPDPDPARLDRPTVRLVADALARPLPGTVIDLAAPEHAALGIVRCVDPIGDAPALRACDS